MRKLIAVAMTLAVALPGSVTTLADARANSAEPRAVIARDHPRVLGTTASFEDLRQRVGANTRLAGLQDRVLSKANTIVSQPIAQYDTSRPNTLYDVSQVVLDRATTLSIAYAASGSDSYVNRLWQELSAVSMWPDWEKGGFLAVGTLSEALGIGLDTTYARLTAAQRQQIGDAILQKAILPAQASYARSDPWTLETGNYNVVANAGIAIGSISILDIDQGAAQRGVDEAVNNLRENGLKGFAPDGGYREGVQYWAYALQHLVTLAMAMRNVYGTDEGLLSAPGLRQTALTAHYLLGPSGTPFNYADSKDATMDGPALLVLADEFSLPSVRQMAFLGTQTGNINQFALLWYRPGQLEQTPTQAKLPLDRTFSNSGVASMRSSWDDREALFVGFKTATPTSNWHPQLDAGTFVLDALGENWVTDLGPDSYSLPGIFDGLPQGARWDYYRNRAEGNNTLVVNPNSGPDQDPRSNSTLGTFRSAPDGAFAIANLQPSVAQHASTWKRGVRLISGRTEAVVQDEVVGNGPLDLWWGFHTSAAVEISADGRSATLTKGGQQLLVRISSPAGVRLTDSPASPIWSSPSPSGQDQNRDIRRIGINISGASRATITAQFTPVRPGVATPGLAAVQTMNAWTVGGETPAELVSLTVNGRTLPGFAPGVLSHHVAVPRSTNPSVVGTGANGATVRVERPSQVPGEARVIVTKAGLETQTYRIFFRDGPNPVSYSTASNSKPMSALTLDQDLSTKWVGAGNQTIQYDLVQTAPVQRVRVYWAAPVSTATRFGILVSDDRKSWRTVYSGNLTAPGWQSYEFSSVSTKHVAILIDAQNQMTRFTGIHEVEIYQSQLAKTPNSPEDTPVSANLSVPASTRVGDSPRANLTVRSRAGGVLPASAYSTTWHSADSSIAKVDQAGKVSVLKAGRVRIGATVRGSGGVLLSASQELTVTDPWSATDTAIADTYVSNGAGEESKNFGTSSGLFVKQDPRFANLSREAYVRFNLDSVRGKEVVSATLTISAKTTDTNGTSTPITLKEVASAWDEAKVTYETKPTLGRTIGIFTATAETASYNVDVTQYIASQVQGGRPTAEIGFTQDAAQGVPGLLALLYGKDSGSQQPRLTITTAYVP